MIFRMFRFLLTPLMTILSPHFDLSKTRLGVFLEWQARFFSVDCNHMIISGEFLRPPLILGSFAKNHATNRNFSHISVLDLCLTTRIYEISVKSSRFDKAWTVLAPKLNRSTKNGEVVIMCRE